MPLADLTPVAESSGFSPSGTTHTISHQDAVNGTQDGNTLVLIVKTSTALTAGLAPPTADWNAPGGSSGMVLYYLSGTTAGQTSWVFTTTSSVELAWWLEERDGLAIVDPLDAAPVGGTQSTASGAVHTTNFASVLNAGSQVLAYSAWGSVKAAAGNTHSWASYTNSFTEATDLSNTSYLPTLAVARRIIDGQGTFTAGATLTNSAGAAVTTVTWLYLFRAADAAINAPLDAFTGYEFGTHGGMEGAPAFSSASVGPVGVLANTSGAVWGTDYLVELRNGSYVLKWVQAAHARVMPALRSMTGSKFSFGFDVEVASGSGTPVIAQVVLSGTDVYVRYDFTNEKLGVEWVGGSTVWQTGTTPLGTQANIELGVLGVSSTHHLAWWISTGSGDGTQTSPTDLTGQAVSSTAQLFYGSPVTATFTAYFDNPIQSKYYAAHPLTPHRIEAVVPEPTGATVSGTSTNFSEFTANGTLTAITGAAGARVDERPPTISASADGVCQTAVAASDYLNLPMANPTLNSDDIIAAVRFVASEWGGTGTGTGTLGWRGHDGLTETTFVNVTTGMGGTRDPDSLTAVSATYPFWVQAIWSGAANGAWTPTRLNAAAVRMGFSTDATPDMGATLIMLEVAIRQATPQRTLTVGDDDFTADVMVHPYNSAVTAYVITNNHPTDSCEFVYSVAGTPQAPVTVTAGNTQTVDIHADSFGDISDCKLTGV